MDKTWFSTDGTMKKRLDWFKYQIPSTKEARITVLYARSIDRLIIGKFNCIQTKVSLYTHMLKMYGF